VAALSERYGPKRGELMVCALTRDEPVADCNNITFEGTGVYRRHYASPYASRDTTHAFSWSYEFDRPRHGGRGRFRPRSGWIAGTVASTGAVPCGATVRSPQNEGVLEELAPSGKRRRFRVMVLDPYLNLFPDDGGDCSAEALGGGWLASGAATVATSVRTLRVRTGARMRWTRSGSEGQYTRYSIAWVGSLRVGPGAPDPPGESEGGPDGDPGAPSASGVHERGRRKWPR
jgi:hypothetical protein